MMVIYFLLSLKLYRFTSRRSEIIEQIKTLDSELSDLQITLESLKKIHETITDDEEKIKVSEQISTVNLRVEEKRAEIVEALKTLNNSYTFILRM